MRTTEIRERFLRHFTERGHTLVPSASLIADDPTLMFTVAGMVPFIPYLTGREPAPYPRAVSVQKCVRTLDIEEVGKTTRHGTFFQMNGNFSFGDYFKEGAITYAWELVTKAVDAGGLGFDPDRLWVTVYQDDDEAFALWRQIAGLPEQRIQRLGRAENYWSTGQPGPSGPDSEIHYDRGAEYGPDGGPAVDTGGDRFLEFWNLVFMQDQRGPGSGQDFPILGELPSKNIDTGMGLERVAYLLQGVDNLYEIDEVRPVIDTAAELSGRSYGADAEDDVRLRVIADHVRTGLMLIGDGVIPSNEGRGYVLRRILRRAVRAVRLLGYEDPAFPVLFPVSREAMAPSYPELATDYERIASYAYAEEEAFGHTLRQGTTMFDLAVRDTKAASASQLPGERVFALHDTFGFPIELTLEMAAEQGLSVDEAGFRRLMEEQRARAKADSQGRKGRTDVSAYTSILTASGRSEFTGYVEVSRESRITGLLTSDGVIEAAGEGEEVEVVLDATPFYAEAGGQQSDRGVIRVGRGQLEVLDVQTPLPGVIVHRARVVAGEVRRGDEAHAEVDVSRRRAISRAHTATHLIHRAIRASLGDTAAQAGSLNAPGRLRFDFTTPSAVSPSVLADVQDEVNAVLLDDLEVRAFVTTQAEARRIGALALFGEKYGDEVRVVEVGDYARELCGGTHAARSGQLGMVQLLSEASIGAGVRRVEALVGMDAFRFLAREHVLVNQLADLFKVPAEQLPERVHGVLEKLRHAEKELEKAKGQAVLAGAGALAAAATDVFGVSFVGVPAPDGLSGADLRTLALDVRGRLDQTTPAVVVLLGREQGRVSFVVCVNEPARAWRLSAAEVVRAFAPAVDGRGGGREDLAQGAGSRLEGSAEALRLAEHAVAQRVTGSA